MTQNQDRTAETGIGTAETRNRTAETESRKVETRSRTAETRMVKKRMDVICKVEGGDHGANF